VPPHAGISARRESTWATLASNAEMAVSGFPLAFPVEGHHNPWDVDAAPAMDDLSTTNAKDDTSTPTSTACGERSANSGFARSAVIVAIFLTLGCKRGSIQVGAVPPGPLNGYQLESTSTNPSGSAAIDVWVRLQGATGYDRVKLVVAAPAPAHGRIVYSGQREPIQGAPTIEWIDDHTFRARVWIDFLVDGQARGPGYFQWKTFDLSNLD
jgi:hypothetical protein